MDRNNGRGEQSQRRPSAEDGRNRVSRSTQTLQNVEFEDSNESVGQSPNDSTSRSNEPGHGLPIERTNTVTESGYDSNRNTISTSEGGAGVDSSNSFLDGAWGYDHSQATYLKSGTTANDFTSKAEMAELYATFAENNNVNVYNVEQSSPSAIQEVRPVEESRVIAQETGEQFDVGLQLQGDDVPVALPPQDVDIHRRRHFHRGAGMLVRCLTCFRWPVAVQNWPCGCICNCLECADYMVRCAQCDFDIDHYTLIG